MEEKRIKINLGNGKFLVAEIYDNDYPEIITYVEKGGVCIQDLAIVGAAYHYVGDRVHVDGGYSVKVYGDCANEDFTVDHLIAEYNEE